MHKYFNEQFYFHCYTAHVVELLSYYTIYTIYKIYKIYIVKHKKTLKRFRHVSVLGPSSGSHIVLAKVTP